MGERRVTRALQGEDADLRAVAVADHQLVIASQGRQGRYRICNVRFLDVRVGASPRSRRALPPSAATTLTAGRSWRPWWP